MLQTTGQLGTSLSQLSAVVLSAIAAQAEVTTVGLVEPEETIVLVEAA